MRRQRGVGETGWQGPDRTHLLPLSSSHEGWLGTLVVDIRPEVVHIRFGRSFSLLDGLVDLGLGLLVNGLELLLGGKTPVLDVFLETTDGVLGAAHLLDFVTGTVGGTGIGHTLGGIGTPIEDDCPVKNSRMTTVTVGDEFHEKRALAFGNPLFCELDALVDGDDVHSVDLTKFVISST